jgi:hypothetical protein
MNAYILPNYDVSYLDEVLLDESGLLRILPAEKYAKIYIQHLQVWANRNGIYCLPTQELIDWLENQIGDRKAIEICAGNGAIGRALHIPVTDSFIQTTPEMLAYYMALGQKPTSPPPDVYEFEANEAVDTLKPKVVVGAYVTQKFEEGDSEANIGSSVYGVDELALLKKVETYIVVGNDITHGEKRINQLPHETFHFEWLYSRTTKPESNHIKIWHNKR